MASRTVSAYVTDDLADRVANAARCEDRSPAQIAAQALRFFMALPREARMSWIALEGGGDSPEEQRWAVNEIARILHIAEFEASKRRMAVTMGGRVSRDASDEDLDALAVEWTRSGSGNA